MEAWHVMVIINGIALIATFVTNKNKTDQNTKDIAEHKKEINDKIDKMLDDAKSHKKEDDVVHGKMFDKIDKALEQLVAQQVQINATPTMEQVRTEFVSKEMFKQMEKHIDDRIDNLGKSVEKGFNQIMSNQMDMASKIEKLRGES